MTEIKISDEAQEEIMEYEYSRLEKTHIHMMVIGGIIALIGLIF